MLDDWFVSAVASILNTGEDRLERINNANKLNDKGIYRFYFWIKDGWYGVNVDDRLPSGYRGKWWTYSIGPSKEGAFWLSLLEKAYAKLAGNYDRMVYGSDKEALRTLTGMPVQTIHHKF